MNQMMAKLGIFCAVALLAGCVPQLRQSPDYSLQREAIAGTHNPAPLPSDNGSGQSGKPLSSITAPETRYGTGVFINPAAAHGSSHGGTNQGGTITFNFDNQPIQVTVKAILGDVLHANYSISPKVKGDVTFATSQPVTKKQVLPILQMLLSWTGNALVLEDGRYMVLPLSQAAPGNVVPGLGAVPPGTGYAARLFLLHYVSAEAMQKLLKPFSDSSAFLLVDPVRNLLVMGGTPTQLANYARIIRTFDVNWLQGMSVAVIPLQHVQASNLVGKLEPLLNGEVGAKGKKLSGLVRLIPLQHSNSLVVITPQPEYVDEVRKLVTTIDNGAGKSSGLYVYNVINVKATDLARHINELFGNGSAATPSRRGLVAPGFSSLEQSSPGALGAQHGFGSFTSENTTSGDAAQTQPGGGVGAGAVSGATQSRRQTRSHGESFAFTTDEGVRIAAVNENNQLLVRAKPGQWQKLLPVIKKLDEKPLQVQVETKVLEVTLSGEFRFGVQYFLGGLIGTQPGSPPGTNESYHRHQGAVGLGGVKYPPALGPTPALFYSFAGTDLQFAISALQSSGDVKVLSAPSAVVLNNREATFKVGEKIPVVQTYLVPGLGAGGTNSVVNAGQVQYIDTGVLLDVVPRVSPGGLVYMDIQQIVSKPTTQDQFGNYTIANRAFSTEVAVQSGQTVLLGGLIQQTDSTQRAGVPFLSRIPVLGRLFGTTGHKKQRTELIVLITPRIVRNPEDARRVTDQYETQFESLRPILPKATSGSLPAKATQESTQDPDPGSASEPPANAHSTLADAAAAPVLATRNGWVVRVATAIGSSAAATHLHQRLQQLGYTSYVTRTKTADGSRWWVFAGPVVSHGAAERLRHAIAGALHIGGMVVVSL